jgi:hypothetical protein
MNEHDKLIAQLLREPIDPNLKVSLPISEIAEVEFAQPGEEVKIFDYSDEDANVDDIYAIGDSTLTVHQVSGVEPTKLSFVGLKSKLETVYLDEILDAPDQNALARKKGGIQRGMDKEELKRICDGIIKLDGDTDVGNVDCEVVQATNDDIYDLIDKMIERVEPYATDYALLVTAAVSKAMRKYSKDNAENKQYDVSLQKMLAENKVTIIPVRGKVNGGDVLANGKLILVGRKSDLGEGGKKPITFVRRLFNAEHAAAMGLQPGQLPGRIISNALPITSGAVLIGYGIFGYEKIIEAITNWRAICWSTFSA